MSVQTQGSLQEADLASLLQTMQSERATGTLTLESGADNAALFFLFGHLFHASGPGGEGEGVVLSALHWRDGNFHFDPRAKLPAEETIKSSPAELISAAERDGASSGSAEEGGATPMPSLRAIDGEAADAAEPTDPDESSIWSPAASVPEPEREPEKAGTAPSTAPAYTPSEYSPTYVPAEPAPVADLAKPASADSSRPGRPGGMGGGNSEAAPVGPLPIPAGKPQYEGLKSAFVDFPRLLRTLHTDRHTGYIRLVSGPSTAVLLFRDGDLVEAEAGDDGATHGEEAFALFRRQMDTGEGLIDVIDLETETVTAIARLLTGPPLFTGLLARFMNFPALLEYLEEERVDGSVIVVGGSQTGVILLSGGEVLAAYTAEARTPESSTDAVASLAGERSARIEVRGDDSARHDIDVEAALSRPH
jgi:hypothetical protein